jgi:hypothetical protein
VTKIIPLRTIGRQEAESMVRGSGQGLRERTLEGQFKYVWLDALVFRYREITFESPAPSDIEAVDVKTVTGALKKSA